jgi:tetratricopeptide (TPR) repeat protein
MTDGYYINLANTTPANAIRFMEFNISDGQVYGLEDNSNKTDKVYGKVFNKSKPLEGVSIKVKGSFYEVFTNEEGAYAISANYGDELLVNYFGVKQKVIEVSNKKNIDIELEFEIQFLEEVGVTGEKAEADKKNNYARKENRGLGYATSIVNAEDIRPADLYFVDVLRRIPQVNVSGPSVNPTIWIRDRRIPPLFIVDNVPSLNYLAIPPQNIHSIEVLKSIASTNRFGADGAGGVIMITTKTAVQNEINELQSKNWALRTDNDYENGKLYPETNSRISKYVGELYGASSLNDALRIYKKQKTSLDQPSISFYFDASEYFERWDSEMTFNILTSIADLAFDNTKALKTLAFKLEVLNKYEEAKFIYQRILELNPKRAQAYRDLAWVYQKTGAYNKAMLLYKQMLLGTIEGVDFSGLNDILVNELRHLVLLYKSEVDYKDLPADILNVNFKQDRRLVFEWNDPFAEFEIQFVNPDNKYFTWELSTFSKKERLLDGVKKGYQIEEFFIDNAEAGKWIVNIKNLKKEKSLNPSYLKYTVYKNFAKPNESKTVRVIKLFEQQEKATLDTFVYK